MLSRDWKLRKPAYDFVIIGSGYGAAVAAARLATANLNPKPSICLLERGKEWPVGSFPDTLDGYMRERRSSVNPLGLYEMLDYPDISVIKGSGLGGTSLVNANVAILPDEDVFTRAGWPKGVTLQSLLPFYQQALHTLAAGPHPDAASLPKVQALARRAERVGTQVVHLNLAVNFKFDNQPNEQGVIQKRCTDCGDCVTGCNVGAKNTLYMNYLPLAAANGVEMYTQTKVESVEKLPAGGWRVHGVYVRNASKREKFTIDAANVVLGAGSINSTEILLRSANLRGLAVSPMLGSRFGGNGDFFGLSYNGDYHTRVLGFGTRASSPGQKMPPGPTIVAAIRYNAQAPVEKRFTIEDLSFASAYVRAAQLAFQSLPAVDTDTGDEAEERKRRERDFIGAEPYHPDGALNHTMLYLCMGMDDQQGYFRWERPITERDGRVTVLWPGAGRQPIFGAINAEIRRHAQREGGAFMENPVWSFLGLRRLITAHPLGGCPMGDDYTTGAVDQYGRVFAADGSVHDGLYVVDGAVVPTALGVNPFLTISAIAERAAARKIRAMQGDDYEAPPLSVGFANLDAITMITKGEVELERVFECASTLPPDTMVNDGTRKIDTASRTIFNDTAWKGFFPKGHILNQLSAFVYAGFQKRFSRKGRNIAGVTSNSDGTINARNTIELVEIKQTTGDLKPGKYILLRYSDPPWQGFYDILKVVNPNLLIGRVYFGTYPHGRRLFTFPMTRTYGFAQMTREDHERLYAQGTVPTAQELEGVWQMDAVSNANHAAAVAHLSFANKPGGAFEARYQLMGLVEGLLLPTFLEQHFQLNDFTVFRDEIRKIDSNLLIGKWVTEIPTDWTVSSLPLSLGIFHREQTTDGKQRVGFYYLLTRTTSGKLPANTLLRPLLDTQLPRGVGMTFKEEMVGWFFEGASTPSTDRAGDLTIAQSVDPNAPPTCRFNVTMNVADLNDFIEGADHEARLSGTITFTSLANLGAVTLPVDDKTSYFNYLRVNPDTGEAEMRYYLEFTTPNGRRFSLEGRKFMQKDEPIGRRGPQEVLEDYTTLYAHVYEHKGPARHHLGTAYLKFRTFEDVAAVGNLMGFLAGFKITGTDNIGLQTMARLRFLAFTAQFVQTEYDPLGLPVGAGGGG
jgi:cholesterol oxidase